MPAWGYLALMSISVIGLVNAANMTDGQNGLLTGLFLIWALCLSLVSNGDKLLPAHPAWSAAAIVFMFNLPGRLFLGDCGSYGVTFVIAVLSIRAHASGAVTVATVIVWFFIPVADCLRLMITRRLSGRSPLSADRDHFHHRLETTFGTTPALAIYLGVVAMTSIIASRASGLGAGVHRSGRALLRLGDMADDRTASPAADRDPVRPRDRHARVPLGERGLLRQRGDALEGRHPKPTRSRPTMLRPCPMPSARPPDTRAEASRSPGSTGVHDRKARYV